MTKAAADFLAGTEYAISGLRDGVSTDMHIRNIYAHVQNALYHTEVTPEIEASAGHLLGLAQQFERRHSGLQIGERAKNERDEHLSRMNDAYMALKKLVEAAEPSDVSSALGL